MTISPGSSRTLPPSRRRRACEARSSSRVRAADRDRGAARARGRAARASEVPRRRGRGRFRARTPAGARAGAVTPSPARSSRPLRRKRTTWPPSRSCRLSPRPTVPPALELVDPELSSDSESQHDPSPPPSSGGRAGPRSRAQRRALSARARSCPEPDPIAEPSQRPRTRSKRSRSLAEPFSAPLRSRPPSSRSRSRARRRARADRRARPAAVRCARPLPRRRSRRADVVGPSPRRSSSSSRPRSRRSHASSSGFPTASGRGRLFRRHRGREGARRRGRPPGLERRRDWPFFGGRYIRPRRSSSWTRRNRSSDTPKSGGPLADRRAWPAQRPLPLVAVTVLLSGCAGALPRHDRHGRRPPPLARRVRLPVEAACARRSRGSPRFRAPLEEGARPFFATVAALERQYLERCRAPPARRAEPRSPRFLAASAELVEIPSASSSSIARDDRHARVVRSRRGACERGVRRRREAAEGRLRQSA